MKGKFKLRSERAAEYAKTQKVVIRCMFCKNKHGEPKVIGRGYFEKASKRANAHQEAYHSHEIELAMQRKAKAKTSRSKPRRAMVR